MSQITMNYRQLGPSGLTVSAVGLGCNSFGVTVHRRPAPACPAVRASGAAGWEPVPADLADLNRLTAL